MQTSASLTTEKLSNVQHKHKLPGCTIFCNYIPHKRGLLAFTGVPPLPNDFGEPLQPLGILKRNSPHGFYSISAFRTHLQKCVPYFDHFLLLQKNILVFLRWSPEWMWVHSCISEFSSKKNPALPGQRVQENNPNLIKCPFFCVPKVIYFHIHGYCLLQKP